MNHLNQTEIVPTTLILVLWQTLAQFMLSPLLLINSVLIRLGFFAKKLMALSAPSCLPTLWVRKTFYFVLMYISVSVHCSRFKQNRNKRVLWFSKKEKKNLSFFFKPLSLTHVLLLTEVLPSQKYLECYV